VRVKVIGVATEGFPLSNAHPTAALTRAARLGRLTIQRIAECDL
jgi:hypothetical protein